MYYVYVLRSQKDKRLYVGFTGNLRVRIKFHNEGRVAATKNRRPLQLVYYEACLDKIKTEKREKYFKTGFGRGFLKTRI